jgi:hypothetical protein
VAVGFLVAFIAGFGFYPAMVGYTLWKGKEAVAQVTDCDQDGRRTDCSGRWRDTDGGEGSGHISGVDRDDVGHNVKVWIGPLGPYAKTVNSLSAFAFALPLLFAPPVALVLILRTRGPARATARRLLAAPPDGATLLKVDAEQALPVRPGEPAYGSLRKTPPPLGFQPVRLPGARPRERTTSTFEAAAGIVRDSTDFATVFGPAGEPLYALERRNFRAYEPETWLLDPGGTTRAVIRRVHWYPATYELLRPDGGRLGRIATLPGAKSGCFAGHDEHGREFAVMALSGRGWLVRIEPNTPPLLRDLTVAFLFDSGRLQI